MSDATSDEAARAVLFVCDSCRFTKADREAADGRRGGEMLACHLEALAADDPLIEVRRHTCLMGCDHHCNVALAARGRFTYVMGSFAPDAGAAEAILAFARLYAQSPTGQVPYRQWPVGVKGHFVSRVPALEKG